MGETFLKTLKMKG